MTWNQVVIDDRYRTASPAEQVQVRAYWLSNVAPQLYPDVKSDPRAQAQLMQYMGQTRLPNKLPDEDEVIPLDSFEMGSFGKLEANPAFGRKSWKQQQVYKNIWYHKMAAADPQFQKLPLGEQAEFYRKLQSKAPAVEGTELFSAYVFDMGHWEREAEKMSSAQKGAARFTANLLGSFTTAYGSLVLGPMRLLSGPEGGFTKILRNFEKQRQYANFLGGEASDVLTGFVPNLVGYGLGIVTPGSLFGNLERILAGSTRVAATGAITRVPGLIGKAGAALGAKLPKIAYETAGGAVAGIMQGITEALKEGKDWKTYVPRELTVGIAAEFGLRYLGMMRGMRKALKASGKVSMREMLLGPLKLGVGEVAHPELKTILQGNRDMRFLLDVGGAVDAKGRPLVNMRSPHGVEMMAELMGFEVDIGDTIKLKKAGEVVQEFTGSEAARIDKAIGWMDNSQEAYNLFDVSAKGKHYTEAIAAGPEVQMYTGVLVPEKARRIILKHLKQAGLDQGMDFTIDPRGDTAIIDRMYMVIRKSSAQKAARLLGQAGIRFSDIAKDNLTEITQIKGEILKDLPEHRFFVVNKRTGQVVPNDEIPTMYLEHPKLTEPVVFQQVYAGNPSHVRQKMTSLRKQHANEARATTRILQKKRAWIEEEVNTQIVEMVARIPDRQGKLYTARIHYPSMKDAQDAITTGSNKGYTALAKHIFDDNMAVKQGYEDFVKAFRKTDPLRARNEYLPFVFASEMASQNGLYLGAYNGKYIVEDLIDEAGKFRFYSFNNLNDTITFLGAYRDTISNLPDLAAGVTREAAEMLGNSKALKAPLGDIHLEALKRNKKYGIGMYIGTRIGVPQHVVKALNKLPAAKILEKSGVNPLRIHHDMELTNRAFNAFERDKLEVVRKLGKGVNKKEAAMVTRWQEGLDNEAEAMKLVMENEPWELKVDVETDMIKEFGGARANVLVDKANGLFRHYQGMYAMFGVDAAPHIKHYNPRLRRDMAKHAKVGGTYHPQKITQIPEADRKFFFEMHRETDPGQLVFDTNAFSVAETYTHLAARKLMIRPYMQRLGNHLRDIMRVYKEKGVVPGDLQAIVNYTGEMMRTIEGIDAPVDRLLRYATENTLETISEVTGIKINAKDHNALSTLLTLTTGAHIAARPFLVYRNMTQSLLTGGTVIGLDWWAEGLKRGMVPGAIERMKRLGVVKAGMIPTAAGELIGRKGVLRKAVHAGMVPYKGADWFNRVVVYSGMEARLEQAIDLRRAGKISKDTFYRRSGAKLFGMAEFNEGARLYNTKPPGEGLAAFKDFFANLAVERTQYLYNSFDMPQAFRSGIGRYFGTYTSWPLNFLSMVTERLTSDSASVMDKVGFLTRLGVTTTAIQMGLWHVGMDPKGFAPWNMMLFRGGPYYQLLNDALSAASGDRGAYGKVVRFLSSMVPFSYEGESILRAVQAYQDGEFWEAFMHLSSAPIRTDVYPRREIITDRLEKSLTKAGDAYFKVIGKSVPELLGMD